MPDLINFWKNVKFHKDTKIAEEDFRVLNEANILISEDEFKQVCKGNYKNNCKIHTNLDPEPFVGDLLNASCYIIGLNPGCRSYDEEYSPNYGWKWKPLIQLAEDNRKQTLQEYKFYYLNPVMEPTGGGKYWLKKFNSVMKELVDSKNISAENALELISEKVCDIELCPYHSCKWKCSKDVLQKMQSIKAVLEFLKDEIIPNVLTGKKSLIVLRHVKKISEMLDDMGFSFVYKNKEYRFNDLDTLGLSNVCFYRTPGKSCSASMGIDTEAGKVMLNALLKD